MKTALFSKKRITGAARAALAKWAVTAVVFAFGVFAARASGPTLILPSSVTMGEDQTTNVSIGVTDSAVAIFTVVTTASSSNTNLVGGSSLGINGAGTNRQLAINPGLHKYGTATITVIARDSQPSATTNTFTLNVTFTNYPPVFVTNISDLSRNENSSPTNLHFAISDVQTASSNLTVTATSLNTSLVPSANLILSGAGSNRTLTISPGTNQNGTAQIELVVTDSANDTATNDFSFDILTVNQPPTFTMSSNRLTYLENYGLVTLSNFVTNVTSGPTNQSSETNFFTLTYNTNFFTQPPALDTNYTLTFQAQTNIFGTNTITFVLTSSGPTTNGGKNGLTNTVTLNVPFVNQQPGYTLSTNLLVEGEETLAVTNTHFLTGISAGPANESNQTWTFTATTMTNDPTNAIFTLLPAVTTNGTLSFHPAAHSFGTNTVTVVMTDSGGTNDGGINAYTNSFQIGITQTNHAPFIVGATNQTYLENTTNTLTASINVWSYDAGQSSNFVLTGTSSSNAFASVAVTGTNVASATNAVFTLTFTLGTNVFGSNTIHLVATEGALSTTNSFTVSVTHVNQAPSYGLSTNLLLVGEETLAVTNTQFLTNLLAGPPNESNQTWTFTTTTVTNNLTNAVFTSLPLVTSNGTLIFHLAAHSFGTNTVTVVMTDNGGTNNGGINAYTNSFQIGIVQTNHAPVIVGATNQSYTENTTNTLTTSINVWTYDVGQSSNFVLTATSSSNAFASVAVTGTNIASATNVVFTIAFTLGTNVNGSATIQLVATEGALSTTNTFALNITPINQPPSYALSTNLLLIGEETLAVTNTHFLTNLLAGPPNESNQTWTFTAITTTNDPTNAIFTLLPLVTTNGTLIFHPAAHGFGTNTVTVVMTDSGGTNNGGINGFTNSFQIGVVQTNHAPVIVGATNQTFLENNTNTLTASINVWTYDVGQSSNLVLTANSSSNAFASVSVTGTNVASATNAVFTITFTLGTNVFGSNTIQLVATEGPLSTTNSFTLNITHVNQAPSYGLSTNLLLVGEETLAVTNAHFLTNLLAGPPNESNQTWTFTATTTTNDPTNAIFTLLPTVTSNGTLIFHPAAHNFGTNTVTVVMTDNGGTTNGGINAYTNSFQIGVVQTNHAPVIVGATNQTFLENNTNTLTASINVWTYDVGQSSNLVLTANSSSNAFASVSVTGTNVASATNAVFTISFTLGTNVFGSNTIQLVATEGALSTTNSFTVSVTHVNQAPSYGLSTNLLLLNEETQAVTNTQFLTNLLAGPPNESNQTWTFTTTTVTNNPTNAIFTSLPLVTSNGTLIFHPAAHSFGSNTVTVVMTDNGGTNNGGINAYTNSFQIGVMQTNHMPVIVGATNQTFLENNTNTLTASINVWTYDVGQSSNLVLTANSSSNAFASVSVTGTNVASATNAVFTVSFTLGTNVFGSNTIKLVATEGALSTSNSFTLNITHVNQAPSYGLSTNLLLVGEETLAVTNTRFLTNLLAGPPNESNQTWTFTTTTVTNNLTNAVFTSPPLVTSNGTLIFHPAAHSFGTNTVTVVMTDNGGTTNGGINAYTNSFQIGVVQTNHAPVIVGATNQTFLENNTNALTASINVWTYDVGQSSNFVLAANSSSNAFASVAVTGTNVASATNAVFTITFTLGTNVFGSNTIQLVATEGALSTTNSFTLNITHVNQAPGYSLSTNLLLVGEETLAVTNTRFLTNLLAGPPNESNQTWTFTTTTVTNNLTNAVFTSPPLVTSNGTLIFHPAAHSFGTNTVTVVMTDNGGTTNGGINAYTNSFQIGVVQTNHAPVIVGATNQTFLENNTNALTASINVWTYDVGQSSNFVLAANSSSNAFASVAVTGTNVASATNAVFTITFTLGTNVFGSNTIQLVATEGALSTTNSFTLNITHVNQAPGYSLSTNLLLVGEETLAVTNTRFLTNLLAGPPNESNQTWTFTATTTTNDPTNAIFTLLPTVTSNGTLIFHPAAHSFGTNTVTVVMTDNGGTTNGGINGFTNSFQIGVVQTNHAPVIVGATNQTFLENNTNTLTASINVWSYDVGQSSNFVLTATSSSNALASVAVTGTNVASATNAVFTITFTLGTNVFGSNTIQLVATEGPLSTTNSFTLNITHVNQAPSYGLSTNLLLVGEETLAVTNAHFLTNLLAGPPNESNQTWTFTATTTTNDPTNAIFTLLPTVTSNGTLIFHPAAHNFGTNTVTVVMTDNGGTTNGGINAYTNSFQIGVVQTNHAPVIVGATNQTFLENNTNALTASINVWTYDLGQSSNFVLSATSLSNAFASVAVTGTNVASATNAVFTITFTLGTNVFGSNTIQLVATEGALSTTNSFTLNITHVNQAPSYGLSTNLLLVGEETLAVTNTQFLTNLLAGPPNESNQTWTFTATTTTNDPTNAIFTQLPLVTTNGTLIFHPAAHNFGTNTVTVVMTDNGGTTNGGINGYTNSFQIGVVQTNHAPIVVGATNQTYLENTTNTLTASINVWTYDVGQSSNFVLTATSSSNAFASVAVTGTNVASATNAVFTLTFALGTNINGSNTIQLVASEGALSTTNTFNLNVTPVNQPPSFTLSTNILVIAENSPASTNVGFLTGLSAGPANESNQTWTFTVFTPTNNATNATFSQYPTVTTNGTVIFRTVTNSFGTNDVTVLMTDSGGTNNGGINVYSNTFQLQVTQVQYPPRFFGITNKTILENASTNLTLPFTLYDPLTTNFTVSCVSSNTNLVVVTVSGNGPSQTLTFAPLTNANGNTVVTVTADDGSLTNTTNFTVTIVPVNQAPSFNLAISSITVDKYDVAVSIPSAITNISPGPTNESTQTVSFTVTNSSPALFLIPPSVNSSGTLAFTPAATGGTVTVGIKAVDDGGTANGGVNTSAVQTLTITIPANPFPYLTGPFAGLFFDTNAVANASSGYFNLVLATNGAFDGYILCAGASNNFSGQFSMSNSTATVSAASFNLGLLVDTSANWTETISGSVSNSGAGWNASLESYLAGYSSSFPTSLAGGYTISLPGFADPTAGPAGDSVFNLIISNNGTASLSGYTADNTYGSQDSQISFDGYYPLYIPLYGNGANGSMMGWLDFTGDLTNAVTGTSVITWFNQPGATTLYPSGFSNQVAALANYYDPTLSDLLSFSSGTVILTGGDLTTPITNAVTVSANVIYVDPSATNSLTLTITRNTGEIQGSFYNPSTTSSNAIHAIILQNTTNVSRGYFLGTDQGGSFILYGN